MNDKLKEIRDKWFFPKYSYRLEGYGTPDCYPKELFFDNSEFTKAIQFIQSETYQLGRQEVIDWGNKPISELEVLWQKAVDGKRYPEASFILYLIDTRKDYTKLAEFCHDNKLGMGGESLVNVIIESYNQLKDKTK